MSLSGRFYYALCRTRTGHRVARSLVAALRKRGMLEGFRMPVDALSLDYDSVAELMRLWGRLHWSSGDGMMPPEQLLAMYRLAATWPTRGDIVELGAWVGLTTCYLAAACRVRGHGCVHAVDTFKGTKEGDTQYGSIEKLGGSTLREFRDRIHTARLDDRVHTLVGLTSDMVREYRGRPIRMLLIDADHSYDGVRSDFELWSPLVVPGGLIVFHDYLMPDVARFVDTVVAERPDMAIAPGQVVDNVMAVTKRVEPVTTGPLAQPSGSPTRAAADKAIVL